MATGDLPESGTHGNPAPDAGITATPPAAAPTAATPGERIELPPPAVPPKLGPDPAVVLARTRVLESLLVVVLLALAAVTASFRAANSDLFMRLAAGRLLAQFDYTFGVDPFSFLSRGYWVNNSWLADLGFYLLYSLPAGGAVLVAVKAAVVTLAAWLMLYGGSKPGRPRWIPLVVTFVAVAAASPRFLLQPGVLSLLLLAETLAVLLRAEDRRRLWLLPLYCALWVNVDEWFVLGPLVVALFLVGEAIQAVGGKESHPGEVNRLGVVLLACLGACLLSPHHVHSFTRLPAGVGTVEAFLREPFLKTYYTSPIFNAEDYWQLNLATSVAGVAYLALVALGLAAFGLTAAYNREGLRFSRLLTWLALLVVSLLNIRFFGLFAVGSAPLVGLTLLELSDALFGKELSQDRAALRWSISGRVLTLLAAVGLVAAAVPGTLMGRPFHRRQVEWSVEVNPSLKAAAETVAAWRDKGLVEKGSRWFNLAPDVAAYFAWYCPGEKTGIDYRLDLFAPAAAEFMRAARPLGLDIDVKPDEAPDEKVVLGWREVFRENGVRYVAWNNLSSGPRHQLSLLNLSQRADEFPLCFLEGSTSLYAWRDPQAKDPPAVPPFDTAAAAFAGTDRAPESPPAPPGPPTWWSLLYPRDAATPDDVGTAQQLRLRFDSRASAFEGEINRDWMVINAARFVGLGAVSGGPLASGVVMQAAFAKTDADVLAGRMSAQPGGIELAHRLRFIAYRRLRDTGPAGDLYLAIRAARRALAEQPDDVAAHLALAEAYGRMGRTRERAATFALRENREVPVFQLPLAIRQAQVAAALKVVLRESRRPREVQETHLMLSDVYASDPRYAEPQVFHFSETVRMAKLIGRLPNVPPEQFREALKQFEEQAKELNRRLKAARDQYEVNAAGKPVLQRAEIAMQNGLAETALNLLIKADTKDLRDPRDPSLVPGATMAMELLLGMGRVEEARDALTPDGGEAPDPRRYGVHRFGVAAYPWLRATLAAATGDYAGADKHLADALAAARTNTTYAQLLFQIDVFPDSAVGRETTQAEFAGLLVGNLLLSNVPAAANTPPLLTKLQPYKLLPFNGQYPFRRQLPLAEVVWILQSQADHPDALRAWGPVAEVLWNLQGQAADLETLRAWLALEAGDTAVARQRADGALALADAGPAVGGGRVYVDFRSRPLARLVAERAGAKPE